jgi:hypothetical protein
MMMMMEEEEEMRRLMKMKSVDIMEDDPKRWHVRDIMQPLGFKYFIL